MTVATTPRPMHPADLADWPCPTCSTTAASGTVHWDNRSPHQRLLVHRLACPSGHRWTNHNDGG